MLSIFLGWFSAIHGRLNILNADLKPKILTLLTIRFANSIATCEWGGVGKWSFSMTTLMEMGLLGLNIFHNQWPPTLSWKIFKWFGKKKNFLDFLVCLIYYEKRLFPLFRHWFVDSRFPCWSTNSTYHLIYSWKFFKFNTTDEGRESTAAIINHRWFVHIYIFYERN